MKLTKAALKRIIKEEISALDELSGPPFHMRRLETEKTFHFIIYDSSEKTPESKDMLIPSGPPMPVMFLENVPVSMLDQEQWGGGRGSVTLSDETMRKLGFEEKGSPRYPFSEYKIRRVNGIPSRIRLEHVHLDPRTGKLTYNLRHEKDIVELPEYVDASSL